MGIELDKLLNFALGTPEIGAVNFKTLHGVLAEIIKCLGVEKKVVEVKDDGEFRAAFGLSNRSVESLAGKGDDKKWTYNDTKRPLSASSLKSTAGLESSEIERKISKLENRLSVLDQLPDNTEILKRAREKKEGRTPVGDIWQFININKRLSATETAIEKLSSLLEHAISELGNVQELGNDMAKIKKSISDIEEQNGKLMERLSTLENSDSEEEIKKIEKLQNDLDDLKTQVESLPTKKDIKDLDICVKWPQFESALKHGSSILESETIHSKKTAVRTHSENNQVPNPAILDTIKQIGDVAGDHRNIMNNIEQLQETMPKKADKKDLDELRRRPDVPEDIMAQINALKTQMQNMTNWKDEMINKGINDLKHMSESLKEFRENLEKLNITTRNLAEEGNKKQKHIDNLYSISEDLQENKADKDSVAMEMDSKADKLALDNMISRLKFDASFGALEESIQNILNRLGGQEASLEDAISKLNDDVDGKLDRMEIDPLKDYINKRIKANKCKHVDVTISDDSAAGMTKPILKFHCISCARPVDVQPGMTAIPLPQYPAFPPSKMSRPHTAYELEHMRQHVRGNYDGQELASTRPCGGQHTMTYTARRANKSNQGYYKELEDEEIVVPLSIYKEETAVQGHDGQLYKGRINDFNEQLPTLQQAQQLQTSPKGTPRPPVAPASPQSSPRPQTPVRPRSAVIR